MSSLVPVVVGTVFGLVAYRHNGDFTDALLWFIWGGVIAIATELRVLRQEIRGAAQQSESEEAS